MKKFLSLFFISALFLSLTLPACAETVFEENNYFKIERSAVELKSRLSNVYTGYEYTIRNIYNEPVAISSVMLWNDVNGKTAYLSTQKTNKQVRSEIWQNGKNRALPTLSLSLAGALIKMPFASAKNSCADKMAQAEANEFNKPVIQNIIVEKDKKLVFKTLTVKHHIPAMKLVFVNPITDENMTILLKQ